MKPPIAGLIVAMVTPFKQDETLDVAAIAPLVNKLIEQGANGLFVSGTAGESWAMTAQEKALLFEESVKAVNGRIPVIAGTGAPTTREALILTECAQKAGCDAVSVVTPYYIKPTQEELYAHFMRIADSAAIPVMVYNIPGFTGVSVEVETMVRLMKAGIMGAKDSSGNSDVLMGYINAASPENCILVGSDPLILDGLKAGAKGCISAPSNAAVPALRAVFDAFNSGDMPLAEAMQNKWSQVLEAVKIGTFPAGVKAATNALVSPVGPCRAPLATPSSEALNAAIETLRNTLK